MSQTPPEAPGPAAPPGPGSAQPTGDPAIDAALERLDALEGRPVHEHPAELEAIHRVLRDSLSAAGRDGEGA